jgi:hypothetical protein
MYKLILQIFEAKLLTGCADVPLLVPIPLHDAVDTGDQDVAADVEFALVVEEGRLEVALDYEGAGRRALLGGEGFNFGEGVQHGDAVAAVGVLAWF